VTTRPNITADLLVVNLTEYGGVEVLCRAGTSRKQHETFFVSLGRAGIRWHSRPMVGQTVRATIPLWLARKVRQLVGDDEYERHKARERGR
jgi:hypothetical protein